MANEPSEFFSKQAYKMLAKKFIEDNKNHILCSLSYAKIKVFFEKWAAKVVDQSIESRADMVNGIWNEVVISLDSFLPNTIARGFLSDYSVAFSNDTVSFEWVFEDWCNFVKFSDEKLKSKAWKQTLSIMNENAKMKINKELKK
jgi:hypothetical protein